MKTICFLMISFFLTSTVSGQDKSWFRNFLKLSEKSASRADVERFFGRGPSRIDDDPETWGEVYYYDIQNGTVDVYYSKGGCSGSKSGWDVVDGVVMSLDFNLTVPMDFAKSGLKSSKLVRKRENDNANYHYYDQKRGVVYTVFEGNLKRVSFTYTNSEPRRCAKRK